MSGREEVVEYDLEVAFEIEGENPRQTNLMYAEAIAIGAAFLRERGWSRRGPWRTDIKHGSPARIMLSVKVLAPEGVAGPVVLPEWGAAA